MNRIKEEAKSTPECTATDHLKILQTILLRRLQPEQFNAVINMMYAFLPSATSEEIEMALVIQVFFSNLNQRSLE